jgi:hypothetical protein
MDAAMDFMLDGAQIPGDPIAAGISAHLAGKDEGTLRDFATNNLADLDYPRWNQTSLGNLLILHRDHRDSVLGPLIADAVRGYLRYGRGTHSSSNVPTCSAFTIY